MIYKMHLSHYLGVWGVIEKRYQSTVLDLEIRYPLKLECN